MDAHLTYILTAIVLYVGSFLISLAVVTVILVKLPQKYFLQDSDRGLWIDHHPVVRYTLIALKNLLGLLLIGVGIMLSVPGIPGQGILTMIIGILLLDFPGKRRWERKLVGYPRILQAINRIRSRFGKGPLIIVSQTDSEL